MKNASNLPRSNVWAKRLRWPRLKLASGKAPGARQARLGSVGGRIKAKKWSCGDPLMPSRLTPAAIKLVRKCGGFNASPEAGFCLLIDRAAPDHARDGAAAS